MSGAGGGCGVDDGESDFAGGASGSSGGGLARSLSVTAGSGDDEKITGDNERSESTTAGAGVGERARSSGDGEAGEADGTARRWATGEPAGHVLLCFSTLLQRAAVGATGRGSASANAGRR